MDIEFNNAGDIDTNGNGWFIGYSDGAKAGIDGVTDLRYMPKDAEAHTITVKWMFHPAGDDRGQTKPPSEGRTISILVSESGNFVLDFSPSDDFGDPRTVRHELKRCGDFVIWGEGIYHKWSVNNECTILTIRWIPSVA